MRTLSLFIAFTVFCYHVAAQNLVPNPGFEVYDTCPHNLSAISYSPAYNNFPTVKDWIDPLQSTTPDYYNTCATPGPAGLPATSLGYKQPHAGNACAGIIPWEGFFVNNVLAKDYREYVETRLTSPLEAGHQYCVSFYVSSVLSGNQYFNLVCMNRIGAKFSSTELSSNTTSNILSPYSISDTLGQLGNDTAHWRKISGTYTASGGEQWLTLGYFDSVAQYTEVSPIPAVPTFNYRQYLFIDDVDVSDIKAGDTTHTTQTINICNLDSVSKLLSEQPGAVQYRWNDGATTALLLVHDTGTYWCTAHYDACNTTIDTFHLVYVPYHQLELGPDTVSCHDYPLILNAGINYYTYIWSTGQTTDTITASHTGEYVLTTTDACGQQKDSVHITWQPATPAPNVSDTTICEYTTPVVLPVAGAAITWYQNFTDTHGLSSQPSINTNDTGAYTFYVSQTINTCVSPKVAVTATIKYTPIHSALATVSICSKDTILLGTRLPQVQYTWTTGDTACCLAIHGAGTYICTISNNCGTATDTTTIRTEPCEVCIYLPNAFTPNGDGVNDILKPVVSCPVTDYRLRIYNRWGQQVFESYNPAFNWDGYLSGTPCEKDTYAYLLEYTPTNTGHTRQVKGNVTLIR